MGYEYGSGCVTIGLPYWSGPRARVPDVDIGAQRASLRAVCGEGSGAATGRNAAVRSRPSAY